MRYDCGEVCLRVYSIYQLGHMTGRSRPTVPLGIFATPPGYQWRSIPSFSLAPNVKWKVESAQVPAPISSIFFLCNKHQVWDPWRVEGGNVTISTLHHTFPHSCLYLPLVAGRSLYTVISSYLLITTYCLLRQQCTVCLLMHSLLTHAQSAYSCTVCLLMHSMHSTLTYAQPSCTVYKDIMDTHFQ